MTSANFIQDCRDTMTNAGLVPPDTLITDGTLNRCGTVGKERGQDGAYIIHNNGVPTLWCENHRTGASDTFTSKTSKSMTAAERKALTERVEADKIRRQEEQERQYAEAAKEAQNIWNSANIASNDYPYLARKDVPSYGLKLATDGRLVIPVMNEQGKVQSLQYIAQDGEKRFLTGGKKASGFFHISAKDGKKSGPLCICEGYATAASVHMATGHACLVSFDAGNLLPVATMARERYPERTIILCADNDAKGDAQNVGVDKAIAAARAIHGMLAIPPSHEGKATDFNDLHQWRGLEAVRAVVEAAESVSENDFADSEFQSYPPSTNSTNPTKRENVENVENVEGGEGEKPLPLRRPPRKQKPYPLEALGKYGEAAKAIAEHVGAPVPMVANSILGMLSLSTQGIANVEHEGRSILLSLYFLSILSSGDRKSTVDSIVMQAVREHENTLSMQYREDIKAWHIDNHAYETAKKNISKGKDYNTIREELAYLGDAPTKPVSPCLTVSNLNIEGLYRLYQEGIVSLGLISDEGGILFGGTAFTSENKLKSTATLSSLWSSGSSDKLRMGEGMSRVHGKRLACHLMLQPIVADPLFSDPILQEQGFLPRFLMVKPESLKGTRLKGDKPQGDIRLDPAVKAMYADCHKLLQYHDEHTSIDENGVVIFEVLRLTPEADELYRVLYNATESAQGKDGVLCEVSNYASRCAEQALRLAGVLTLAQDPAARNIPVGIMQQAANLALWYLSEAKRIMENSGVSSETLQAEKLLRWLQKAGQKTISQRTMAQYGPLHESKSIKAALQTLHKNGYVRPAPSDTILDGKRCKTAWEVLWHDEF